MRTLTAIPLLLIALSPVAAGQEPRGTAAAPRSPEGRSSLPRSAPERQGVSSAALLECIDALDRIDMMNSFMLVRHGRVVAEGWWAPYEAATPHILYSLSKSFTSTGVGLAAAEGKLSLDDPVLKYFPEDAPAEPSANLRAMRIRDLLRMNTGHQTEPPLVFGATGPSNDPWTKKFLAHPVPFKPGSHFLYNTAATYMCSAIVQKATGMTLLDYLRPRLFEPLGFEAPQWGTSPQGVTLGGYGLSVRTEEIARFGQLYLQKGKWKGRQLLPPGWVEEATARQTSNGSSPTSDWDQGYGYQFWRCRHNAYRGDGAFGQYCLVLPEHDAVVAITSGVRDMQAVMDVVWEKLLPALKPASLSKDDAGRQRLETRLASLAVRYPSGAPASSLAASVSGRQYEFGDNDRSIRSMALDFSSGTPVLVVRDAGGERRTPVGIRSWVKTPGGFNNGLERSLGVAPCPLVAASGAWSANDVFTVKLVLPETPFYSTLSFRFDGDRLLVDSEHNVGFGPTRLPQLTGRAASAR